MCIFLFIFILFIYLLFAVLMFLYATASIVCVREDM